MPAPSNLPKNHPRYKKWLETLKHRPPPWNKGKTKENDKSVRKISKTFKRKGIDNFLGYRSKLKKIEYKKFARNEDLATLIGIILGDGNIHKFPRTEKLTITLGTDKPKLIKFTVSLVKRVIGFEPKIGRLGNKNAVRVTLYQKYLSKRFGVMSGSRRQATKAIPSWGWKSKKILIAFLRGLYEAEGSICVHLPTYTYNLAFANRNPKMLSDVARALKKLGYHPEVRNIAIRLRKKAEVKSFQELISFRSYIAGSANGRHPDSESGNLGPNPSPAAK